MNNLADDGKPYVSAIQSFRDANGNLWRVRYQCGTCKFQITDCHGFYVLFSSLLPGLTREKRYSSWDSAYRGLLALRRRYA